MTLVSDAIWGMSVNSRNLRPREATMQQYRQMRYAGCALLAILFFSSCQTPVSVQEITVNSKATGRFGQHPHGFGGIALDMVTAFVFDDPSTIEITATGQIDLHPRFERLLHLSPDGTTFDLDRDIFGFLPLEEAAVDTGVHPATLPDVLVDAGALIGAVVPKLTVDRRGFFPRDEDYGVPGIASDQLFVIGSGPCEFMATEPGTLFLGINDNRAGNNTGSFTIKIRVSPSLSVGTPPCR